MVKFLAPVFRAYWRPISAASLFPLSAWHGIVSIPHNRRSEMTETDPAHRVRQLLLSGDNILKNQKRPERVKQARERFQQAHQLATTAGLDRGVVEIIERRLSDLGSEVDSEDTP